MSSDLHDDLHDGNDDGQLGTRMRQSMEGVHTDSDRIVSRALTLGRTRVRRRRTVAGVAAAVIALGIGGYAYALGSGSDRLAPQVVAVPSVTPTPAQKPTPTPAPRVSRGPGETAGLTRELPARVAALYLIRLAPDGEHGKFEGQQNDDTLYAETTVDLGDGPVGLEVNVQAHFLGAGLDPDGNDRATTEQLRDFYDCSNPDFTGCEASYGEDGSILRVSTERAGKATIVIADQLRSDGTRVVVRTGNSVDLKYGGDTRDGVSPLQAKAIATSDVWDLYSTPSDADTQAAKREITPWTLMPS